MFNLRPYTWSTATACVCGLWIKNTSPDVWYLETAKADMVWVNRCRFKRSLLSDAL